MVWEWWHQLRYLDDKLSPRLQVIVTASVVRNSIRVKVKSRDELWTHYEVMGAESGKDLPVILAHVIWEPQVVSTNLYRVSKQVLTRS